MLTNFVTDSDLQGYYPKIVNYLWKDSANYSAQIALAFSLVKTELLIRKIDPRKLHIPIDLNRAANSTADQNILTSVTKTATYSSTHVNGIAGFNRFVINVSAIVSTDCTYSIVLQGSNDQDITDSTEPTNWVTVKTLTPIAATVYSGVCDSEYKYYRYTLTITGATASIAFTTYLVETFPDQLIIWKTFELIFRDFTREKGDVWEDRMNSAVSNYDMALENLTLVYDTNDDNIPDEDEQTSGAPIKLIR